MAAGGAIGGALLATAGVGALPLVAAAFSVAALLLLRIAAATHHTSDAL
ncbi:hypothetical protein [Tsukamurella sp. PLM1]|nr:hypothetical protein [Tsukamurella sp. PLM1]